MLINHHSKTLKNTLVVAASVLTFYAAQNATVVEAAENLEETGNDQIDSSNADLEAVNAGQVTEEVTAEETALREKLIAEIKVTLPEELYANIALEGLSSEDLQSLLDEYTVIEEAPVAEEISAEVPVEEEVPVEVIEETPVAEEIVPESAVPVFSEEDVEKIAEEEFQAEEPDYDGGTGSQENTVKILEEATVAAATPQVTIGNKFLDSVSSHAVKVANENNLFPSVMMAQAALESGYGGSALSSAPNHNLFGIKGNYEGQSVTYYTNEYTSNGWIRVPQTFRKYPSFSESFEDNAQVLRNGPSWNPNYYSGAWRENASSYKDATQWLTGRYATDPKYNTKLNGIIQNFGLDRFDNLQGIAHSDFTTPEIEKTAPKQAVPAPAPAPAPTLPASGVYTVQAGDTLWRIATNHRLTVSTLKDINALKSDVIHVGQVLSLAYQPQAIPEPKVYSSKPVEKKADKQTVSSTYKVQVGDTLSKIAGKYNTTVSALRSANNITNAHLIYVGQELNVKVSAGVSNKNVSVTPAKVSNPTVSTPPAKVEKVAKTTNSTTTYRVVKGDTLYGIARRYNTSVSELAKLNSAISAANAHLIYVGQVLNVQGSAGTSSQAVSSAPAKATKTYRIAKGDTLYAIARRNNTSVSHLAKLNNISNTNLISVGQVLRVR